MIGFYMCIMMAVIFFLIALFFALGKERAANWLSGFHSLPEEERVKYDRKRMAADTRRDFLLWGAIMLAGALVSLWISGYGAAAAWAVWLVLFFKNVHLDEEKAFGKYKQNLK